MTDGSTLESRRPQERQDNQHPDLFGQTPSQTVGPFFHYGMPWKGGADLVGKSDLGARPELFGEEHYVLNLSSPTGTPEGEQIELVGTVRDAEGAPIADAMIEIWQANAAGRYRSDDDARDDAPLDPHFVGFGRAATSDEGEFLFRTIMPGRVPAPGGGMQATHIAVSVFARGAINRLATRLYFDGGEGLADDPVLACIPEERRATLMATREGDARWRFDIALGGPDETVFFDL